MCQELCSRELIGGDGRRWESFGNLGWFARRVSFTAVTGGTLGGQRSETESPLVQGPHYPWSQDTQGPYTPAEHAAVAVSSPLHHCPSQHLTGINKSVLNPSKELGPCFLLTPRENKLSFQAGGRPLPDWEQDLAHGPT